MEYKITSTFKLIKVDEEHFDIISTATDTVIMCLTWDELAALDNALPQLLETEKA